MMLINMLRPLPKTTERRSRGFPATLRTPTPSNAAFGRAVSRCSSTPDGGDRAGHCCPPGGTTRDIEVYWSVSDADKYDKWKIYRKKKEASTRGKDHCDYNSKTRKIENNFYVIPDLEIGEDYRLELEGRKAKNGKWKCLLKAVLRGVDYSPWLSNGGICVNF